MNGPLEWIAAAGTIVAAFLVASDFGRRVTGWGFVLFAVVSVAWIVSALLNQTLPLAIQNAILLAINAWGVWQYLLNPTKKREIERQEKLAGEAKDDVKAGRA